MAKKKTRKNTRRRNAKLDAPDAFSQETEEQVQAWLREAVRRPGSFGLFREGPGGDQMFVTWSLGPVVLTRDSPILDEANWKVLRERLESDPSLADDYAITHAGHWAVGWVDHLSFRAIDPDGSPSRMARILKDWNDELRNYSIADEDVYSEMQQECFEKHFDDDARDAIRGAGLDEESLPKDWIDQLYTATSGEERCYHSGDCPYVCAEDFTRAISQLGWGRASNHGGPMAIKQRRRLPTSQQTKKRRSARRRRPARPYRRQLQRRPYVPPMGAWQRPANPKTGGKRGGKYDAADAAWGAGLGSLLGSLGGFIVGAAFGGLLGAGVGMGGGAGASAGLGLSGSMLGGVVGGGVGNIVGGYQGGKRRAPRGEEKGAAWGGGIGAWLFGPVGAAGGAYLGAKANPGHAPRGRRPNGPKAKAAAGAFAGNVAGAMVGSLAGPVAGGMGSVIGAGVGANMAAPKGRKERSLTGGAIGAAVAGPIGAPIGAAIGARKPDKRKKNPEVRRLRNRLTRE